MELNQPHFILVLEDYKNILKKGDVFFGFEAMDLIYLDPYYDEQIEPFYDLYDNLMFPLNSEGYIEIKKSELHVDHMLPKLVTKDEAKKFLKGDINYNELCGYLNVNNGYDYYDLIDFSLNDLYEFLTKNPNLDGSSFDNYKNLILKDPRFRILVDSVDTNTCDLYLNDSEITYVIFILSLCKFFYEDYLYNLSDIIESVKTEIDYFNNFTNSRSKIIMSHFVETHAQEANYYMFKDNPKLLETFRLYLDNLIALNDILATKAKAYLDYEGAFFWKPDYKEAEVLLNKLVDLSDVDAFNTLGYLYYYHNPSGEPDYDKAFKCFSLASLNGNAEAKLKLYDMISNGLGVKANFDTAFNILKELYKDEKTNFLMGNHLSKFPDVLFRMAKVLDTKNIFPTEKENKHLAKRFITESKYTLAIRQSTIDYIGDNQVFEKVNNYYHDFEYIKLESKKLAMDSLLFHDVFQDLNLFKSELRYEIFPLKNEKIRLKIYVPKNNDLDLLLTLGDYGKSIFTKEIIIEGFSPITEYSNGSLKNFKFDIEENEDDDFIIFFLNDKKSFFIVEPNLILDKKLTEELPIHKMCLLLVDNQKLSEEAPLLVSCDGLDIHPDDRVVIDIHNREQILSVYKVLFISENELTKDYKYYLKVKYVLNHMIN